MTPNWLDLDICSFFRTPKNNRGDVEGGATDGMWRVGATDGMWRGGATDGMWWVGATVAGGRKACSIFYCNIF